MNKPLLPLINSWYPSRDCFAEVPPIWRQKGSTGSGFWYGGGRGGFAELAPALGIGQGGWITTTPREKCLISPPFLCWNDTLHASTIHNTPVFMYPLVTYIQNFCLSALVVNPSRLQMFHPTSMYSYYTTYSTHTPNPTVFLHVSDQNHINFRYDLLVLFLIRNSGQSRMH